MPDFKYYGGITRAELEKLRQDLAKEGVSVPEGDEVKISGMFGVELQGSYDESKETLKVGITKKPFYVPESEVWKIVDTGTAPYIGN